MKEIVRLNFPLENDLFTTARLTAGGVCSYAGLNLDDSEDLKVCLTEGLLLLLHGGFRHANVVFFMDGGLFVSVEGEGALSPAVQTDEDEIGVALLRALAEDAVIERAEGVQKVTFRFGIS